MINTSIALNTGLIIFKSNEFLKNEQIAPSKVKQSQRPKHRNELVNKLKVETFYVTMTTRKSDIKLEKWEKRAE